MASLAKRVPPVKAKQPSRRPPRRPTSPPRPYLRFYHSAALRRKTLSVLAALERAPDATKHGDKLANVVVELMNSGMDYYFMEPLKKARVGFIVEQTTSLGLAGVRQVMASVIRQVIGRMSAPQLLSVSRSIRELML